MLKKKLQMILVAIAILIGLSSATFAQTTVISETFVGFTVSAGSTDLSTTLNTKMQTTGWTGSKIYENTGNAKLGSSSALGYIVTPTINLSGNGGSATLKLDLQKYSTDAATVSVYHAANGTTFTLVGTAITPTSTLTTYTVNITGGTASSKIKITGNVASSGRFYLDNVLVQQSASTSLPTVTTTAASGITTSSATSGGNVSADGGATVTAKGVCWSTTTTPTIANSKTADGTGTGTYTSSLTGLTANTTYYVRAYATNSVGTAYGTQISFTTGSATTTTPTVSTTAISSITTTSATSGGNVTSDGGATVTAKGVCWSTTTAPTVANSKTADGTGTGSYTSSLTGLVANTTYYVRAYATNSIGTAYGTEVSFATSSGSGSGTGTVTVSVTSLYNFKNTYLGMQSEGQYFTVSGTGLSGNITVSAPTGFVVSTAFKTGYSSTVTLSQSGGTLASTKVFARFSPSALGAASGNINITGASAAKTVAVSGTGITNGSYIPSGYYSTATGTGAALKTQLYNKIGAHTVRSYTQLWTDYQTTDLKYNGKVWDMYGTIPDGVGTYEYTIITNQCGTYSGEGGCYNREHSFPKSWWGGATITPYTDLFHLVPTDGYVNAMRSNYPFGNVSSPTYTSQNGSKLGPCSYPGYTGIVFEPIDEYKGDFARNYFYMATCYENIIASWQTNDTNGDATLNGTSFPVFETWVVNLLLEWNANDPVSQKEVERNQAIYGIQGNRNPFIDHPEYANQIWGSSAPVTTVATVTTTAVSAIANASATSGGNVTADGGATVTAKGVCWGTTTAPTIAGSKTTDGTGTGAYTSSITGLTANTTYYVRAYATNSNGTAYGSEVSFTTTSVVTTTPTVTTTAISAITSTTATSGGNVTSDGGATVTAKGVCWATTTAPTIASSKTTNGTGAGAYTSSLTGLTANTTYYLRSYATNSNGTSYGSEVSFTTSAATAPTYCTVKGTSVAYEWIDLIQLGTINNATAANAGYGNFTTLTTNLALSNAYTVTFSAAFASTAYTEYWKIWIDYNQNGTLGDAGELVASGTSANNGNYTATFTVPATALLGNTRMRVLMSDANTTSPCGTFSYGEVEDYTVNITAVKSFNSNIEIGQKLGSDNVENYMMYPNPSNDVVNITLNEGQSVIVEIYTLSGALQKIQELRGNDNAISISELPAGAYLLNLKDGKRTTSKKFIKY